MRVVTVSTGRKASIEKQNERGRKVVCDRAVVGMSHGSIGVWWIESTPRSALQRAPPASMVRIVRCRNIKKPNKFGNIKINFWSEFLCLVRYRQLRADLLQ